MGSNTFPQQQSMGQMPPQMAPMQQQDQQTGFSGMYAPQYGANVPMAGGIAMSGGMQGYGGGQSVPNYAPSYGVMPQQQAQYFDPMVSDMAPQAAPQAPQAPQAMPNYQVQPVAGYGGYAQQPMQQNPYDVQQKSSRQGPQRLY